MADDVVIAFADHQAAKFAVEHWHYSRSMPIGKNVKVGLWEHGEFVGVAVVSSGVGNLQALGFRYGLRREQTCELARVALRRHDTPVSKFVPEALRLVREVNPGLELVVSYADPEEGHVGRIYQAMNWTYTGPSAMLWEKKIAGRWRHNRTIGRHTTENPVENPPRAKTQFGNPKPSFSPEEIDAAPIRYRSSKFRYLYAFDKPLRRRVAKDGQPYPDESTVTELVQAAAAKTNRPVVTDDVLELSARIVDALTPDLLTPSRRKDAVGKDRTWGHCYVASEALWHELGGRNSGWSPYRTKHEGDTHWWLQNGTEILDPTADQFETPVPYTSGIRAAFLTKEPSKRAQLLLERIR